jgi:hypothetical protein
VSGSPTIAVLASGGGRSVENLAEKIRAGDLDARIGIVIADRECGVLERCRRLEIPARLLPWKELGPERFAARAYAALDKRAKQHYHQGEYYAWLGNLKGAVEQLQLAAKAGDANFYEASVVETRLRVLRREIAEQQKEVGRTG